MKKITLLFTFLFAFANQTNAQFTEGFEAGIPATWTVLNGGDANTWIANTFTPHGGTGSVSIVYTSPTAHDDYFVTPSITVASGVNDRFSFWARSRDPLYPEVVDVVISTTTPTDTAFTTTLAAGVSPTSGTNFYKYTYDLSAFIGQTIYIAFHSTTADQFIFDIDDVVNEAIPFCSEPSNIVSSNITDTSANITWEVIPGSVNYEYVLDQVADDPIGSGTSIVAANYTASSLVANTLYYIHIRNNCDGAGFSVWTTSSFTTAPFNPFTPYSGPLLFSSNVEPITLVNFAGIDNTTDGTADPLVNPAHENFISIVASVNQGSTYPIILKGNTDGNYTNRFIVFIDWNQNTILDDVGEVYFSATTDMNILNSTGTDAIQATGNIIVPADALTGNTRMRIKKIFGTSNFINPNLGSAYGQVEDYTVNIAALAVDTFDNASFSYYPNPVKDVLNLSYNKNISKVAVYNLVGQEVATKSINATQSQIDMSNLSRGTYLVKVTADNQVKTIKVVKE